MAVQQLPRLVVMVPQLVIDELIIHFIKHVNIVVFHINLIQFRFVYADSEGGQGIRQLLQL